MAIEDLTTYTEVDPNGHITVDANTSTFTDLPRNEDAYVYKDKGVDHFNGDFEHLSEIYSSAGTASGMVYINVLANLVDDAKGIYAGGGDMLTLLIHMDSANAPSLYMREYVAGTEYTAGPYAFSPSTLYYLKFKRDEGVGTYGTLYCYLYSDAARTNLLTTLTLTLHAKKDFRYIYVTQTYNSATTEVITGYYQNLDLQEAPPPPAGGACYGYVIG